MRDLEAFFYAGRAVRFGWRAPARDCLIFAADWVAACGLPDPASRWRGRYTDSAGARRLVKAAGGMVEIVGAGLAKATRLPDPETAESGDIGVVIMGGTEWGLHPLGAIRAGAFWAIQATQGVLIGEAEALAAWRF